MRIRCISRDSSLFCRAAVHSTILLLVAVMQNSIFDTDKRFKIDWTNSLGIHQLFITRSWFHSPEVALKFL